MNTLGHIIVSVGLFLGSLFGYHQPQSQPQQTLGAFNPTGGGTYRLQSSIGGSATTLTLTSFKEPVSGIPYTMSYLNSTIEYATIEPQSSNKEFVSFTGITQNADGTATLTGLSRGLGFSYPFTASTTLQQSHSAQSILILSNPPQLYNQYANKSNNDTISGNWTFSGQTTFNNFPISPTNSTSSYNVSGGAQLALPSEQAASTATSSNGNQAPLVLASKNATTTYNSNTKANVVPVTNNSGIIDPKFVFNGTSQTFPSAQGASSTVLANDSSGGMTWEPYNINLPTDGTYPRSASINGATTTLLSATVPAGMLGSTGLIHGRLVFQSDPVSGTHQTDVAFGNATTSMYQSSNRNTNIIEFYIQNTSATTQLITMLASSTMLFATTTGAVNTANATRLIVEQTCTGTCTGAIGSAFLGTIEVFRK